MLLMFLSLYELCQLTKDSRWYSAKTLPPWKSSNEFVTIIPHLTIEKEKKKTFSCCLLYLPHLQRKARCEQWSTWITGQINGSIRQYQAINPVLTSKTFQGWWKLNAQDSFQHLLLCSHDNWVLYGHMSTPSQTLISLHKQPYTKATVS